MIQNIYIIGVGLIGGSLALDIKNIRPETTIFGIDKSEDHLNQALDLGVINNKATLEDLDKADLVVLAIPVDVSVTLLPTVLDKISDFTLVADVGSTKSDICKVVEHHPRRRNFLAMHPIAGTEFSGPKAAIRDLFKQKTNIICEVEKTAFKLQEKAVGLFSEIGMRMRYMNPESHDKHIAYVSHLSHISAFMLGKTVIEKEKNERDIFDMAGSGFESTVRLAKSSPAMWTPIFKLNKNNVVETLDDYIANLTQFKKLIENDDFEGVFNEMKDTNYIKQILNGIQ
ncbi:prephenate dehydrogenase [Olleya sp. YSTF-M6]|uniref:Prephenate dehydrogenase n=1 Tax=Olleya sediminilitoris TaxID=2795739 RepID=A0ABS1WJA0_9FLAO|nr:prephenate dehydrogenase [Olleya sediminilitoris]MBL7559157.1 prephenate dehydrogenase [Olleya sediminilitoris]